MESNPSLLLLHWLVATLVIDIFLKFWAGIHIWSLKREAQMPESIGLQSTTSLLIALPPSSSWAKMFRCPNYQLQ